jgi:hypothetical protein
LGGQPLWFVNDYVVVGVFVVVCCVVVGKIAERLCDPSMSGAGRVKTGGLLNLCKVEGRQTESVVNWFNGSLQ